MSLSYDGCISHRVVLHELGHALGLWHEHSRPDRDEHILVVEENVRDATSVALDFRKLQWSDVIDTGLPYDYRSVMHYSQHAFGKGRDPTIVTSLPEYQEVIGKSEHLSVELESILC